MTGRRPLVSVVTIFLDAERFLDEAIASVFAQTYESWELLLVDDGSTDRGSAIAHAAAARDPRVRCLCHDGRRNLGMSASRNLGIAEAHGSLIAFLDADDVWLPFKLEHQVRLLQRHPEADLVFGPTGFWYGWTGDPDDRARDFVARLPVEPDQLVAPPELLVRTLEAHGGMLPGTCSLLVRRSEIDRIGGFEAEFRGSYEDQVFLAKAFRRSRIFISGRCSDRYRQHEGSSCAIARRSGDYDPDRPHPARRRYLTWLDRYLAEHPLAPGDRWGERLERALAREWLPYRRPLQYRTGDLVARSWRFAKRRMRKLAAAVLPAPVYRRIVARYDEGILLPLRAWLRFGRPRRGSKHTGGRGLPLDRHYLEAFLARSAADLRGRRLVVGASEVAAAGAGERIGDPAAATRFAAGSFDCILLLQADRDPMRLRDGVRELDRVLAPGGVLLAVSAAGAGAPEAAALEELFGESFPRELVRVRCSGNRLVAIAFARGFGAADLRPDELDRVDPEHPLLWTARVEKPTAEYLIRMAGRWDYSRSAQRAYGDDTTYRLGIGFLDLPDAQLEDWGCGLGYARRFVQQARYVGIDGSPSRWTDKVVDLTVYRSDTDCVFVRHVLEHNPDWQRILDNALASFRRRMALILFTPLAECTGEIARRSGIPDIAFCRQDLIGRFPPGLRVVEQSVQSKTQYGVEHLFLLERESQRADG